jgi:hypothetical protein
MPRYQFLGTKAGRENVLIFETDELDEAISKAPSRLRADGLGARSKAKVFDLERKREVYIAELDAQGRDLHTVHRGKKR